MNSYKIDEKNLMIDQGLPRYSPRVRIPLPALHLGVLAVSLIAAMNPF